MVSDLVLDVLEALLLAVLHGEAAGEAADVVQEVLHHRLAVLRQVDLRRRKNITIYGWTGK